MSTHRTVDGAVKSLKAAPKPTPADPAPVPSDADMDAAVAEMEASTEAQPPEPQPVAGRLDFEALYRQTMQEKRAVIRELDRNRRKIRDMEDALLAGPGCPCCAGVLAKYCGKARKAAS